MGVLSVATSSRLLVTSNKLLVTSSVLNNFQYASSVVTSNRLLATSRMQLVTSSAMNDSQCVPLWLGQTVISLRPHASPNELGVLGAFMSLPTVTLLQPQAWS